MEWFKLQPSSITQLAEFILAFVIASYLIGIRHKSRATWFLTASTLSATALFFTFFITNSLYASTWLHWYSLTYVFSLITLAFFLQFAYAFPENPYPREARLLGIISTLLIAGFSATILFHLLQQGFIPSKLFPIIWYILLSFTLWNIVVLIRKFIFFSQETISRHNVRSTRIGTSWQSILSLLFQSPDRRTRSIRALIFLNLLVVGITLPAKLRDAGLLTESHFNSIMCIGLLSFLLGLAVIYSNYSTETTTVQVRLVGVSLATMLAVLGMAGLIISSPGDLARESGNIPPENTTIRFRPDGSGGFLVNKGPLQLDQTKGEHLALDDGENVLLPIGFDFPFSGRNWDKLVLDENGVVTFFSGAPSITGKSPVHDFSRNLVSVLEEDTRPKLAPFFSRLNPSRGGSIYYNRQPGRLILTWMEVPDYLALDKNTFQLTLFTDGSIEFSYHIIRSQLRWGGIGFWPGGKQPEIVEARFSENLPERLGDNTALIEDYMSRYRQFAHEKMSPLAGLIVGSTFFILLFFPLFFQASFIKPLSTLIEGIARVNRGNLNTQIPIIIEDEIGYLSRNFNQMTDSLRAAEDTLRAYAEELEEKVMERTAELEESLIKLTSAQDRLIQQEKMASLGHLTAGIAHEIKNPLNFVNNFALLASELTRELEETLKENRDLPVGQALPIIENQLNDIRFNVTKVHEHGKRADSIVRSMLLHARNTPEVLTQTDINALLEESLNLVYHGMRAQHPDLEIDLQREYDKSSPELLIAPREIGRVFLNLVTNAFQAVHEKKSSRRSSYTPKVVVQTQTKGDTVEIRVSDNGPGISKEHLGRVFEPFFTTKPTGQGTGLGLSLAYDIITQGHGGTLSLESEKGEGATFIIRLPRTSVFTPGKRDTATRWVSDEDIPESAKPLLD